MRGPGLHVVNVICPDCYRDVECEVWVSASGATTILKGPDEHRQNCSRLRNT